MKTDIFHFLDSDQRFFLSCAGRGLIRALLGTMVFAVCLQVFTWLLATAPNFIAFGGARMLMEMAHVSPTLAFIWNMGLNDLFIFSLSLVVTFVCSVFACMVALVFVAAFTLLFASLGGYKLKN